MNQVHSFIPQIFLMLPQCQTVCLTLRYCCDWCSYGDDHFEPHLLGRPCVTVEGMLVFETGALASGQAIALAVYCKVSHTTSLSLCFLIFHNEVGPFELLTFIKIWWVKVFCPIAFALWMVVCGPDFFLTLSVPLKFACQWGEWGYSLFFLTL